MSWVVQSIRALAGTHVDANIEIGGAGFWLPRNPTGAPAHTPLFSTGAIIRASTVAVDWWRTATSSSWDGLVSSARPFVSELFCSEVAHGGRHLTR